MTAELMLSASETAQFYECEAIIERGLKTFVDVGQALLTMRDNRLYRFQWDTFEDYCRERWNITPQHGHRLMAAAQIIERLEPMGSILPESERQARPLTQLPPEVQPIVWQRAVETAPNGKITAAHVQSIANEYKAPISEPEPPAPAAPSWYQSSESDDWWTPQWLYDALDREVHFETDVCASHHNALCANYYTREDDALRQRWTGRCWMNPPYGRSGGTSIYTWIEKAYTSAMSGDATVACFIPARTDTTWWWDFCIKGEIRFLKGRIKFANSDSIAPFPSAVVIFWPGLPLNKATVEWWFVKDGVLEA